MNPFCVLDKMKLSSKLKYKTMQTFGHDFGWKKPHCVLYTQYDGVFSFWEGLCYKDFIWKHECLWIFVFFLKLTSLKSFCFCFIMKFYFWCGENRLLVPWNRVTHCFLFFWRFESQVVIPTSKKKMQNLIFFFPPLFFFFNKFPN